MKKIIEFFYNHPNITTILGIILGYIICLSIHFYILS